MTLRLSANPNPTTQGATVTICYEWDDEILPGDRLVSLDWDGAPNQSVLLSETNPCATVNVPLTATSLICEADDSDDYAVTILPA